MQNSPDTQIVVASKTNIFADKRDIRFVDSCGKTLKEILVLNQVDYDNIYVSLNGENIPKFLWETIIPKESDIINVCVIPMGGEGGSNPLRMILTIAVIVAAAFTAGGSLALFGVEGLGSAVLAAVVSTVGMLAVNAIAPPTKPEMDSLTGVDDEAKKSPSIAGGRNPYPNYGVVPVVLGMAKMVPPHGALPYTYVRGNDQYLTQLFMLGLDDISATELKLGETLLDAFSDLVVRKVYTKKRYFNTASATNEGTDLIGIPATGHGLPVGVKITIYGESAYNGDYWIHEDTSVDKIIISTTTTGGSFDNDTDYCVEALDLYKNDVYQEDINIELQHPGTQLWFLDGGTASNNGGNTQLPIPSHGLGVGQQITIYDTANYDGLCTVLTVVSANAVVVDQTFTVAEQFADDVDYAISHDWMTYNTQPDTELAVIDISFPNGLVNLIAHKDHPDPKLVLSVDYEFQYAPVGTEQWSVESETIHTVGAETDIQELIRPTSASTEVWDPEATYGPGIYVPVETHSYYGVFLNRYELTLHVELVAGYTGGRRSIFTSVVPPTLSTFTKTADELNAWPLYMIKVGSFDTSASAFEYTDYRPDDVFGSASDFVVSAGTGLHISVASGTVTVEPTLVTAATRDTLRLSNTIRFPTPGQYKVRVRKTTVDKPEQSGIYSYIDDIYWSSLKSIKLSVPPIDPSAPEMTLLEMTVRATDQLNGAVDNFNCIVDNQSTSAYDTENDQWLENTPTSNCADLYRHVLQCSSNKKAVGDSRIDLDTLEIWHHHCLGTTSPINNNTSPSTTGTSGVIKINATAHGLVDGAHFYITNSTNYSGQEFVVHANSTVNEIHFEGTVYSETFSNTTNYVTQPGLTYNKIIDYQSSINDILREIASAGKAAPGYYDGKHSVVLDKVQSTAVQHFTPRNSWGFSSNKTFYTLPHGFRCRFVNELENWREDERVVYNTEDGYSASNADKFEEIEFPGVTHPIQIFKHARYHMATARLRPEKHTFSTDLEYLVCTRGDRVRLSHDVPAWTDKVSSGRIKSVQTSGSNVTSITLDEQMEFDSAEVYCIRMRRSNGSSSMSSFLFNIKDENLDGFYTVLNLDDSVALPTIDEFNGYASGSASDQVGSLVIFGERNSETVDMIITHIEPQQDLTATITVIDYAPSVHDSDTETIPDFDPNINMNDNPLEVVGPPVISSVRSDESVAIYNEDGTINQRIEVSFSWADSAMKYMHLVRSVNVTYRLKSPRVSINTSAATNEGSGKTGIPITDHSFLTGDRVVIENTASHDGIYTVQSSSTTNSVHINKTYSAETFGADDVMYVYDLTNPWNSVQAHDARIGTTLYITNVLKGQIYDIRSYAILDIGGDLQITERSDELWHTVIGKSVFPLPPASEDFVIYIGRAMLLLRVQAPYDPSIAAIEVWRATTDSFPGGDPTYTVPVVFGTANRVKVTNIRETNITPGDDYYYWVGTVDIYGNQSETQTAYASNPIAATATVFVQGETTDGIPVGFTGDIWYDTDDGNKPYVANGNDVDTIGTGVGFWNEVTDSTIAVAQQAADDAQTDADTALAIADGTINIFLQTTEPSSAGESFGDIWIDTTGGAPLVAGDIWRYEDVAGGSQGTLDWYAAPTNAIGLSYINNYNDASDAYALADGKVVTFIQDAVPTGDTGDIWLDSNDNDKAYYAKSDGSDQIIAGEWEAATADWADVFGTNKPADGATQNEVFFQSTAPAGTEGDIWIDTDDNQIYTNDGTSNDYGAGANGWMPGKSGQDAEFVMIYGEQVFKFLEGQSVPESTSITLSAVLFGTLTTYDWEYWTGSAWQNLSGTQNTSTYSLAYDNAAWSDTTLRVRCLSGSQYDEMTIAKLYDGDNGTNGDPGTDGDDAVVAIVTNEAHVCPADNDGTVTSYSNSGTEIHVYEGTTELTYDGTGTTNGTWNVTAVDTNITVGTKTDSGLFATFGNSSAMTADQADIVFTITGKTADGTSFPTITKTQSISKSKAGGDGTDAGDLPDDTDLIGYYPFDGSIDNKSGVDIGTMVYEQDDGTLHYEPSSVLGGGIGFKDLIAGSGDRLRIPQHSAFSAFQSVGFTFSFWCRGQQTSTPDYSRILNLDNGVFITVYNTDPSELRFWIDTSTGKSTEIVTSGLNIFDTKWHHIVMKYVASTGVFSAFVDGQFVGEETKTGNLDITTTTGDLCLGNDSAASPSNPYWGYFDEFRIYDSALTDAEILALYLLPLGTPVAPTAPLMPSDENLVGYWGLDNTAIDNSGNGNDGTINGTVTYAAGISGGAADFSATGDIAVDFTSGGLPTTVISISCWIKLNSHKNWNTYARHDQWTGAGSWLLYSGATGKPTFGVGGTNCGHLEIETGQWYHIVGVYDGSQIRIYVNGDVTSTPASKTGSLDGDTTFKISRNTTSYCDGLIDEVRVYAQVLTPSEIKALYLSPSGNQSARTIVGGDYITSGTITGSTLRTASIGKRFEVTTTDNEAHFYGDRGDTTIEDLCSIGIASTGESDSTIIRCGWISSYNENTCIAAKTDSDTRNCAVFATSGDAYPLKLIGYDSGCFSGIANSDTITGGTISQYGNGDVLKLWTNGSGDCLVCDGPSLFTSHIQFDAPGSINIGDATNKPYYIYAANINVGSTLSADHVSVSNKVTVTANDDDPMIIMNNYATNGNEWRFYSHTNGDFYINLAGDNKLLIEDTAVTGGCTLNSTGLKVYNSLRLDTSVSTAYPKTYTYASRTGPSALQAGDVIYKALHGGYNGVGYIAPACIETRVSTNNWSATDNSFYLMFSTVSEGNTSTTNRWTIEHNGHFLPVADYAYSIGSETKRVTSVTAGTLLAYGGTVGSAPNKITIKTKVEADTAQGDVYSKLDFAVDGAENSTGLITQGVISSIKAISTRTSTRSYEDSGIGFYTLGVDDSVAKYRGCFTGEGGFHMGTAPFDTPPNKFQFTVDSTTLTDGGSFEGLKSRSGSYVTTHDSLVALRGKGWNATADYRNQVSIELNSSQTWTSTARGTYIRFATTENGTTTRTNRWDITNIGTLTPYEDSTVDLGSTSKRVKVAYTDDIVITSNPPASNSSTGTTGMIQWDGTYLYMCTATDTWKRVAWTETSW
jgi:hypothetical protein